MSGPTGMIYRVRLNGQARNGPPAKPPGGGGVARPPAGEGAEARWFVAQIASRYSRVFHQSLPVAWSDLVRRLQEKGLQERGLREREGRDSAGSSPAGGHHTDS